jgi:hypothetical protein
MKLSGLKAGVSIRLLAKSPEAENSRATFCYGYNLRIHLPLESGSFLRRGIKVAIW